MKKEVLGLSGSPREGGNTDLSVGAALDVLESAGLRTGFLRIYDYRIEECKGCRDCMNLGHCATEDDDADEIFRLLRSAKGAVIGAPVYWNGPPGRMKHLIDRSHGYYASQAHRLLSGLKVFIISVATSSGFDSHEDIMMSWLRYYGAHIVGKERIYAREIGDLPRRPEELEKARRAGISLLRSLTKLEHADP